MNVLVFDTETTGLTHRHLPDTHPAQPDMVQLGAILLDDETGRVRGELNLIVKPEGRWTVPEQAANVHGITTEVAEQYGLPLLIVMAAFNNLAKAADAFICHNAAYDLVVAKKAYKIVDKPHPFDGLPTICTMEGMSPVMKLPPTAKMVAAGFNKPKPPSLMEAYGFITGGQTFDMAHDAMADVRATVEVYRWLRANGDKAEAA